MACLPDPGEHAHLRPTETSEEDVAQRRTLLLVAVRVDVQHDRPRRAELVVAVADDERDGETGHVAAAAPSVLDQPRQCAEALPVRRTPSRYPVGHAAGTDRVAVAGLEIRAADGVRHA